MRLVLAILGLIWAFLLVITGGRFLILLLDANRENEIVDWVLRKSDYWVKPFFNLFDLANKGIEETGGFFEPASLLAFVVYLVVGGLVLSILRGALSGGFGGWHTWRHA